MNAIFATVVTRAIHSPGHGAESESQRTGRALGFYGEFNGQAESRCGLTKPSQDAPFSMLVIAFAGGKRTCCPRHWRNTAETFLRKPPGTSPKPGSASQGPARSGRVQTRVFISPAGNWPRSAEARQHRAARHRCHGFHSSNLPESPCGNRIAHRQVGSLSAHAQQCRAIAAPGTRTSRGRRTSIRD